MVRYRYLTAVYVGEHSLLESLTLIAKSTTPSDVQKIAALIDRVEIQLSAYASYNTSIVGFQDAWKEAATMFLEGYYLMAVPKALRMKLIGITSETTGGYSWSMSADGKKVSIWDAIPEIGLVLNPYIIKSSGEAEMSNSGVDLFGTYKKHEHVLPHLRGIFSDVE